MKLKIAQLGQPVLRKAAAEVSRDEIATPEFQQFLSDMRETVASEKGAGLAAPQVFASRRVFLALFEVPEKEEAPRHYHVLINPRIVAVSRDTHAAWEGCLSFAELVVQVRRHKMVRVEYLDENGQPQTAELTDFPARVIQHEYDHLDGILTIDRAVSTHHIIKASELDNVLAKEQREGEIH
jgi:peptide deformylase